MRAAIQKRPQEFSPSSEAGSSGPFGSTGRAVSGRPKTGVASRLAVRRLTLTDFRCYTQLRLETDGRSVVLSGPNGAGKTNLLEALSLLAPGRGLRGARLTDMDRIGGGLETPCWAVAAELETPAGPVRLGTGRDPEVAPVAGTGAVEEGGRRRERRLVRVDGLPARGQAALGEHVGVVWLTPDMDRLFRDAAAGRRRFLDRMVAAFDGDHSSRLLAYGHNMRERSRLLRDRGDAVWLAALEEGMAEHGVAIAAARRALVARLDQACALGVGPFPAAGLRLVGDAESWLDEGPALAVEDRLRAALAAGRQRDALTGGAAVGPQRSDLAVSHLGRGMPAALCSTGEQKALLVSIVLAHVRLEALARGAAPLLLLDEAIAHLDGERRAALFDEIAALGAQAWLTGTDAALFAEMGDDAQHFHVEAAAITPAAPDLVTD